jgi:hypothetical protein
LPLPVFLLHDAWPGDEAAEQRVLDRRLLPIAGHEVTDLGLTMNDVEHSEHLDQINAWYGGEAVPVDLIPYPALSAMLIESMQEHTTLGRLWEKHPALASVTAA